MSLTKTALLLVDIQNDFCPGGALPVMGGDEIVAPVNRIAEQFERKGWPIFLTRDWHPEDHVSFKEQGGPWPRHCVANTEGAAFHPALNVARDAVIVSKATAVDAEAYSGFAVGGLDQRLKEAGVNRLVVAGLATEYCVKHTVMDGLKIGFAVTVVADGIRAVDVHPGDGRRALADMRKAGAAVANLADLLEP